MFQGIQSLRYLQSSFLLFNKEAMGKPAKLLMEAAQGDISLIIDKYITCLKDLQLLYGENLHDSTNLLMKAPQGDISLIIDQYITCLEDLHVL